MTGATPDRTDSAPRPQMPDEVGAHIREKIMNGLLRHGDHLHLEHLADELGISVTPIREGLLALRGEGFVDFTPRRGFTVAQLGHRDIADVYRVRATISGELAARAARVIEDEQLAELITVEHRIRQSAPSDTDELDTRFHGMINELARSGKLTWFLGIAMRYTPRHFSMTVDGWLEASTDDHGYILQALQDRDPVGAREAAHAHVVRAGTMLIRHLDRRGFFSAQR